MKTLIIGIGNPGRQDDGLGPALIDKINRGRAPISPVGEKNGGQVPISREMGTRPLSIEWKYQLNIEDAHAIKDADLVVFADATREGDAPATLAEITATAEITFTTHAMAPASVLALAEELYGRAPKAYLLAIRGYAWDIGEELSAGAAANLDAALSLLADFLAHLKSTKKTRSASGNDEAS